LAVCTPRRAGLQYHSLGHRAQVREVVAPRRSAVPVGVACPTGVVCKSLSTNDFLSLTCRGSVLPPFLPWS
jgi:hypothetical protein